MATADWQCVSVACVPDDTTTTPGRYDATEAGLIKFQAGAILDLYFWCNVLSPLNNRGDVPTWQKMYVTFRDSNADGFVQVTLFKKTKVNGVTAPVIDFMSTAGPGVREEGVGPLPPFDFVANAYSVRVHLYRSSEKGDPEFHVVSLKG